MAKSKKKTIDIPGVPEDFGNVLALLDGREPTNDDHLQIANGGKVEDILPITTALTAKPMKPQKPAFDPSKLEIGQMVKGKGVYVGAWEPKDCDDQSLGKTFDLYAAPQDVVDAQGKKILLTFNDAAAHVAGLNKWHGYDGADLRNDTAVYDAIREGRLEELEKWFIPTRDVVDANLYQNKDKGALKDTFTDKRGSDGARWYWSCTEHPGYSSDVCSVDFTGGDVGWDVKDDFKLSTRPVRAELRPS